MSTFIVAGISFVAGVCAGVVLSENNLVKVQDLRNSGEFLVNGVRYVIRRVKGDAEVVTQSETI